MPNCLPQKLFSLAKHGVKTFLCLFYNHHSYIHLLIIVDILITLEESSSRALKTYLVSLLKDFFKTNRIETFFLEM